MIRTDLSCKSVINLFLPISLLAIGVAATSAADLIENVGEGRVNWSLGLVTANGIGAPPKAIKNPAQIRAMTQRAAISAARRNLLEVLKGVRIDSETKVANFILSSDVIKNQVSGTLQGSQVMQARYFSDGSIEVTVGVQLQGELTSALMPPSLFPATPASPAPPGPDKPQERPVAEASPAPKEATIQAAKEPSKESVKESVPVASPPPIGKGEREGKGEELTKMEASPSPLVEKREAEPAGKPDTTRQAAAEKGPDSSTAVAASPIPSTPSGLSEVFKPQASPVLEQREEKLAPSSPAAPASPPIIATGLVIDARGLGLKPALLPRILNEGGSEIYGTKQVSRQNAVEQGLVGYAKDVAAAQRSMRVTDKPLLVKGIKAAGKEKTDVVIPDLDAATVVAAASAFNFLEKSKVIIVYD
jgi:hypothetical protein